MSGNKKKVAAGGLGVISVIIAAVFAVEGGYVNNPNDPGGATNHGVTQKVARKHGYTGDMRDFSRYCTYEGEVCAESIYYTDYILKPGFVPIVKIDPYVGQEVIDTAVNMGPARPSRYFQNAVNKVCGTRLSVDGKIGPLTVRAWSDCRSNLGPRSCVAMLDMLDDQQEAEYDRLVRVNRKLRVFRRGWQNHRIGNVDRAKCWTTLNLGVEG